ncbi:nucleotidyltransferase domain-containing protein [Streptomyces sp. AC512_CC834]|uniref:nucleotidyltransferase domain-containing protein n=1 Tax=Streptomyces sp. AC512_CC834 TaxID=2823691 RepID=UPI001C277613|nr:nucleotidyltransferase domain-containing protein [Streptomyces sp. AC512_CC834]
MKRARATSLLNDMLDRLEEGGWPLDLVDEILVFGSYARGVLEPADVDVIQGMYSSMSLPKCRIIGSRVALSVCV